MDFEQVLESISAIAKDPSHKQHFNALKMLAGMNSAAAALPEPLDDRDIQKRLARLMQSAGKVGTRLAYHKAFPLSGEPTKSVTLTEDDINIEPSTLPRTLKTLYKRYPWLKRPGFPRGYPAGKGLAAQEDWVRTQAMQAEIHLRQKVMDQTALEAAAKEKDGTAGTAADRPGDETPGPHEGEESPAS